MQKTHYSNRFHALAGRGEMAYCGPMQNNRLSKVLRRTALGVAVAGLVVWLAAGHRLGWTQTSVSETKVDPVTELPYTEYRDAFVAGIEIPALGLGAGAALLAASWIAGRRRPSA